jgi:hypothetical protein
MIRRIHDLREKTAKNESLLISRENTKKCGCK